MIDDEEHDNNDNDYGDGGCTRSELLAYEAETADESTVAAAVTIILRTASCCLVLFVRVVVDISVTTASKAIAATCCPSSITFPPRERLCSRHPRGRIHMMEVGLPLCATLFPRWLGLYARANCLWCKSTINFPRHPLTVCTLLMFLWAWKLSSSCAIVSRDSGNRPHIVPQ